ncbi:MAG: hypothetical protein GX768_07110 [Chloroflexi bacterium]|nr:hypothetical protein [Chloroflexota bacterium]
MSQIVFICTKNQFRSPLAAAILNQELATRNVPGEWIVDSAGSWVADLAPATPEALIEAAKRGLDLSSHTAKGIETLDFDSIDLLLVMEQGQKESVLLEFPKLFDRTFLVSELSGPAYSIPDPYITKEPYDVIAHEIEVLIKDNFEKIVSIASRKDRT